MPLSVIATGAVNGADIFDVSLSEHGVPISLFYHIKPQKKKRVFIDTVAEGARATAVPEPMVPAMQQSNGKGGKVKEDGAFFFLF